MNARNSIYRLFLLSLLTVISISCSKNCRFEICDAPDVNFIDGIHFSLNLSDFSLSEEDSVFILKFNVDNTDEYIDSVCLTDVLPEFILGYWTPFATYENPSNYIYHILSPASEDLFFEIKDVKIQGKYPEYCCCCYENVIKTFSVNEQEFNYTGSHEALELLPNM
ncbi:MAG: hypothetical protein EA412_12035 [Chitinophagaceae bacterium]|nr:MAG: hypothetical protein EA412_12035 [Chitinophagaceae bacterium]